MHAVQRLLNRIENINTLYITTFLLVVTLIAYTNTLGNQLFFDDEDFIYNNTYVRQFSVDKFFTQNAIAGAGKPSNYYRPLQELSYSLETQLFGVSPFIYHLDNLLMHALVGILLYILLKNLFKNKLLAVLTSTLFLIHPIVTEAVTYASGRNDPMAAIFILLTIIFYMRKNRMSILFFALSLLARESAIVTPGLLFLVDLVQTKSLKQSLRNLLKMIPIILVGTLYIAARLTFLNFADTLNFYPSPTPYSTHLTYRLLTFVSTIPTYLGLIFFPKTLFIDRDIPVVTSLIKPVILMVLLTTISTVFLCIKYFKQYPLFLFALGWTFITLIPTSGIIPINGIMYEHFFYLPSIGIFLAFSYLTFLTIKKIKSAILLNGVVLLIMCLMIALVIRTISRNNQWHDPIVFYTQTISNNPNSPRLHNNLAMALADQGNNQKAIQEYKQSIALADIYPETHYDLANTYVVINDTKNAADEYQKAIAMNPYFVQAYINLALLYKNTNQQEKLNKLIATVKDLAIKNPGLAPLVTKLQST